MSQPLTNLFSPLTIGRTTLRNRIVSTGHDTCMTDHGLVSDDMIAYHRARSKGGAGLIVLQVASVHETAFYTSHVLRAHEDDCIPGLRKLAGALHEDGAAVFGQLLHPGREIHGSDDGTRTIAWSASEVPNERFHVMPRALGKSMIDEIVASFADTAKRMIDAGLDGVEVVASFQYLASQFLSEKTNRRTDEYGGSFENRMRFLREVLTAIRTKIGPEPVIGIRISADDLDNIGLTGDESLQCCIALEKAGLIDYVSLSLGSSASRSGAYHIVPAMHEEEGYSAPYGERFTKSLSVPVIITGRIVQPQTAERIIENGQADACGMTRAMICDPEMPLKAEQLRAEDIRACIGCNQACIGHFFAGASISCIQNPESGRERVFPPPTPAASPKTVLVVGGGPAGMKAAVEAARRGHRVTLAESGNRLGGQALVAQLLPGRQEFGGLITNLEHEMKTLDINIETGVTVDRAYVERMKPDDVIVATGSVSYRPEMEGEPTCDVVTAEDILTGTVKPGSDVVIADSRCDWVGIGVAEKLAQEGCRVRLAVNGVQPGEDIMPYLRDHAAGRLFNLGVEVIPYVRLFGADGDTVYLEHTAALAPVILEGVDTLVLCIGQVPRRTLLDELQGLNIALHDIGDCRAARTAEEAVLEGHKAALAL